MMTLTKKHWMIIGVVIALIVIWYFFLRKKKPESNFTMPPDWVRKGGTPPQFPQSIRTVTPRRGGNTFGGTALGGGTTLGGWRGTASKDPCGDKHVEGNNCPCTNGTNCCACAKARASRGDWTNT